jgi:hypothetical protein
VSEKERDADRRLAAGGEPLVGEKADRLELQPPLVELPPELADADGEVRPLDANVEIADPKVEEVVVGEGFPGDLGLTTGQDPLLAGSGGPRIVIRDVRER